METEKIIIKENLGIESGSSYVFFQLLENEENQKMDFRLVAIFNYQVDANDYLKSCPSTCIYIMREKNIDEILKLLQRDIDYR